MHNRHLPKSICGLLPNQVIYECVCAWEVGKVLTFLEFELCLKYVGVGIEALMYSGGVRYPSLEVISNRHSFYAHYALKERFSRLAVGPSDGVRESNGSPFPVLK